MTPTTPTTPATAPAAGSSTDARRADGSPWATLLAAAVGCFTFGLAVCAAQAFPQVSRAFNLYNPTGDLSGKSALAVVVWLVAWLILKARWSTRPPRSPAKIAALSIALILLAFAATFPPLFGLLPTR